ncbi:7-carboxy-7-deazaguanine synthase [Aidingimonas lacisalsi]|uniref:7-carboxy-7-deazaguanine synthase n=1 Tax=Aidingimonas lacisalsi TaxID=2604086 RepID=UPI0011D29F0A|nr:7-carboxy-7-deazaguanine synthase [Aidingimonas lacisalsi]
MYHIKEAFYTLQGEGARTGRASVFCRFSGCNLWSGRAVDRPRASCRFCDTDFVGTDGQHGGSFSDAASLAEHLLSLWPTATTASAVPYVVFTGGEPLLQLDASLVDAMHARGFEIAVETNGTLPAPDGIDWLCVSPKGSRQLALASGDELKLVYPQDDAPPERFETMNFTHFYLQPMDVSPWDTERQTTSDTIAYCLRSPQWRLSLQTHKITGID